MTFSIECLPGGGGQYPFLYINIQSVPLAIGQPVRRRRRRRGGGPNLLLQREPGRVHRLDDAGGGSPWED